MPALQAGMVDFIDYGLGGTQGETDMIKGFTFPKDRLQAGRLKSALEKRYSIGGNVRTLGEHIIVLCPVRRSHYIRHYARKKTQGEYKRLRTPAHTYTLWYLGPGIRQSGLDVPKIVYDSLPYLAEKTIEEPIHEERRRGTCVTLRPAWL
jgi:hypothetical protein